MKVYWTYRWLLFLFVSTLKHSMWKPWRWKLFAYLTGWTKSHSNTQYNTKKTENNTFRLMLYVADMMQRKENCSIFFIMMDCSAKWLKWTWRQIFNFICQHLPPHFSTFHFLMWEQPQPSSWFLQCNTSRYSETR